MATQNIKSTLIKILLPLVILAMILLAWPMILFGGPSLIIFALIIAIPSIALVLHERKNRFAKYFLAVFLIVALAYFVYALVKYSQSGLHP